MAQDPSSLKTTGGWFILMSARCMVDHPDAVRVTEIRGSQTTVLELSVDRSDYKRVIGHRGRTADALRSLLLNIAGKEQKHYVLEILEPSRTLEEMPPSSGWEEPPLPMPEDE